MAEKKDKYDRWIAKLIPRYFLNENGEKILNEHVDKAKSYPEFEQFYIKNLRTIDSLGGFTYTLGDIQYFIEDLDPTVTFDLGHEEIQKNISDYTEIPEELKNELKRSEIANANNFNTNNFNTGSSNIEPPPTKYEKYEKARYSMIRVEKNIWETFQDTCLKNYSSKKQSTILVKRFLEVFSDDEEKRKELFKMLYE